MRQPETLLDVDSPPTAKACLAVVDVGSNAIRLQIAKVFDDRSFSVIHDEREPVRLGEEVFRTGALSADAIHRALDTLSRFAQTARRRGALRVRSVATSAVREASNGDAFLAEVERAAGLRLEIISGSQEARLIARGVLSTLGEHPGRLALVDIGGGSTEISVVADGGEVLFGVSVLLGSVRMTEMFCRSDPLLPGDERAMREHIRACLADALPTAVGACPKVIGSAGTIGAVANYIRRRPSLPRSKGQPRTCFSVGELAEASETLRKMSLAHRRKAPGIEERRAEIVVAGAIILEEICAHLRARTIRVVRRGLRDGLMLEEVERLIARQHGEPVPGSAVRVTRSRRASRE